MIKIYDASNGIEAKLILDLLQQNNLESRINGEYLQGGVGDLQASGIVCVMIGESDYVEGKILIEKWKNYELVESDVNTNESTTDFNKPEVVMINNKTKSEKILTYISIGILGLLIGIFSTITYYKTPTHESGIDYDGDGIPDELWVFKGGRMSETRTDRNFDKKIDLIYNYDHKGFAISMVSDDNFDGVFESESKINQGNIVWIKADTTGDGFKNYRTDIKNGVLDSTTLYHPKTKKKVRINKFVNLVLAFSEIDSNGDGVLDSKIEYDAFENPVKTYLIQ